MTIWKVININWGKVRPKTFPRGTPQLHILYLICLYKLSQTVGNSINSLRKDFVHYL